MSEELPHVEIPPGLTDDRAMLVIPDGVTLMGARSPANPGGILAMSHRMPPQDPGDPGSFKQTMLRLGSNSRITGLRLRGYKEHDTTDEDDPTRAIRIEGSDVLIDNNEIFGWPNAGVEVINAPAERARTARVTGNFIHNNVQCNLGYGIAISQSGIDGVPAGFARIDHNVFDYNRHHITSAGGAGTGYVAELNFALNGGPTCDGKYNQHFDQHGEGSDGSYDGGTAGTFIDIRRNTFRGAQSYGPFAVYVRPAFELRGTPVASANFHENVVPHSSGLDQHTTPLGTLSSYGAVRLEGVSLLELTQPKRLFITRNQYCVDTAAELAVGDFDGDGRDDVFQAVGTLWVYSPSGRREWFVLNDSTLRLKNLGLGDFDGDGKTDVFTQSGDRWLVSYGGTGALTPLPAGSSIGIAQYRFGDFDGDGKTDVFRANGSQFFISSGGATAWIPLAASSLTIGALRFGDFDGDGRTDVFSLANSQWSVSYGGATTWVRLNRLLSSSLGGLVFADFDGDHRTDVARSSGGIWQVSWGGRTEWQTLQYGRSESLSVGMLFGDFTGDGHADVLQHGARTTIASTSCWAIKSGTTMFESRKRFRLSSGGATTLQTWSSADMR